MNHLDRATRRLLEERAKQLRIQGQIQGWSRDHIVSEILAQVPAISPLEAYRIATGWTRLQLSQALDALYTADGLMPPHITVSEICRWEHGVHQPNQERQQYLTRLYRTRPDRLGFGRDYSPQDPEDGEPSSPHQGPVASSRGLVLPDRPLGVLAGEGDRIVSVRWVPDEEGDAELVVEVEDGNRDGRAVVRFAGLSTVVASASNEGQAPALDDAR
jgi:hypothetical protein